MEFYNVQLIKILHMCCFNSQRDGILHKFIEKRGLRNFEFQFPTGWNSTGMDKNFRRLARDVSIPKGIDYSPNLY